MVTYSCGSAFLTPGNKVAGKQEAERYMWGGWKWIGLVLSLILCLGGIENIMALQATRQGVGDAGSLIYTGVWAALAGWCLYLVMKGRKREAKDSFGPPESRQQGQAILDGFRSGHPLPVKPVKAILHPGEIALIAVPGALHEYQTVYKGRGVNVRVRVSKSISIGQSAGQGRGVQGLVKVSDGEFVVTRQRVIFAGQTKSFEAPLSKLTNVEAYTDGTGLHLNSAVHVISFPSSEVSLAANFAIRLALEGKPTQQRAELV